MKQLRKTEKMTAPQTYTHEEVSRVINSISSRSVSGLRNRALIMLLFRSGLRCQEALDLRPMDLDRRKHSVRVLCGKGGKERVVGMEDFAFEYIERWLEARELMGIKGNKPLFCSRNGKALQPSYVRKLLPRLEEKARIGKRLHAHGFRHSLACEMLRAGEPLQVISAQLGHARLSTTDNYLRKLDPVELLGAMKRRKVDRSLFDGMKRKKR